MAKFLLKASLIPKLEQRNVIDPVTGKITMRVNYGGKPLSALQCVEFQFYPTDVLEINDAFGAAAVANKCSPKIRVGVDWFISDPTIPWFDPVSEATPTNVLITQDGTHIMPRKDRKLLRQYAKDTDVSIPAPMEANPTNEALLVLAKQHQRDKALAK